MRERICLDEPMQFLFATRPDTNATCDAVARVTATIEIEIEIEIEANTHAGCDSESDDDTVGPMQHL
jgi:hypothetical protein